MDAGQFLSVFCSFTTSTSQWADHAEHSQKLCTAAYGLHRCDVMSQPFSEVKFEALKYVHYLNTDNQHTMPAVTGSWAHSSSLGLAGGWRLPRRDMRTHNGINKDLKSSSCSEHFNVPHVVFKITTMDRLGIQRKPCVFGCLLALQSRVMYAVSLCTYAN